jgi:hypothetical protein
MRHAPCLPFEKFFQVAIELIEHVCICPEQGQMAVDTLKWAQLAVWDHLLFAESASSSHHCHH